MQVQRISNSPHFGLKLNSNRKLSNEFLNNLKTSTLIKDVEKAYPDTVLYFRDLSNQAGVILEFNLGNGNRFSLTGISELGKNPIESLSDKLKLYNLAGMEEVLEANSINYFL